MFCTFLEKSIPLLSVSLLFLFVSLSLSHSISLSISFSLLYNLFLRFKKRSIEGINICVVIYRGMVEFRNLFINLHYILCYSPFFPTFFSVIFPFPLITIKTTKNTHTFIRHPNIHNKHLCIIR